MPSERCEHAHEPIIYRYLKGWDRSAIRTGPIEFPLQGLLIAFRGWWRRPADQSECGIRIRLPHGEVIGRDRQTAETEHVAAGIGHASRLGGDLVHVHSGLPCQRLVIGDCPHGQIAAVTAMGAGRTETPRLSNAGPIIVQSGARFCPRRSIVPLWPSRKKQRPALSVEPLGAREADAGTILPLGCHAHNAASAEPKLRLKL
jgi:hypothetical protein